MKPLGLRLCSAIGIWSCAALGPLAYADACSTQSGPTMPTVIELYTSEGCNSCPPADRWLSRLKADPGIVALAFHVDYWDRLGWRDRFASPEFSERQAREGRRNGASFSYTPQVVLNGEDFKAWRKSIVPSLSAAPSVIDIALERNGSAYSAKVSARQLSSDAGAPRLAAFWAVTEHGHATSVKAGENRGVKLEHDFVVREYEPVAQWAANEPQVLRFQAKTIGDAAHPRQVNLVVTDGKSGKPLQAVKLSCPPMDASN